jgi:hypothetical protein
MNRKKKRVKKKNLNSKIVFGKYKKKAILCSLNEVFWPAENIFGLTKISDPTKH